MKRIYFHISTNHRIMVPEKPMMHWHGSRNKVLIGVDWNNTPVGPTLNVCRVSYLNFPKLNLWTLQNKSLPGYINFINSLFFSFIFISWRLITLQYCSGFCHTLTWISHGFTCVPYPDPPSCLPPHPIPLGLPSAPALSTCLMHPTWAGDLFHPW